MKKDLKDIVAALEEQGFTVKTTTKGHLQVKNPEGQVVAVLSGTPSDWRSTKNAIARLRRAGFEWSK